MIFIIDYGLAKKYRDQSREHKKGLYGTARFASMNAHAGLFSECHRNEFN